MSNDIERQQTFGVIDSLGDPSASILSAGRVTYNETCDACHTPVEWHQVSDKHFTFGLFGIWWVTVKVSTAPPQDDRGE